ncbi:uncharacterized protein [Porites lutea]|uniref:uncharacterized protein n=1 Tax=Porites lutea TaxID=51062 RepID=UPI003CC5ED1A
MSLHGYCTFSGTGTLTVTNPIWVIKTRLCLQYTGSPAAVTQAPQYKGMMDALFKLWRHEDYTKVTSPDGLVCHIVLSSSWLMKNLRKATAITLVHQSIQNW